MLNAKSKLASSCPLGGPGVCGLRLAGPRLPGRLVQPVPAALLPVSGGAGGRLPVGSVDQCALPLPLPLL